MGFSHLSLAGTAPENIQANEARALASGADDVLLAAKSYPSLEEASRPFQWIFGLTSRDREFGPPAISLAQACKMALQAIHSGQNVAFLFGPERTGLENEDLDYCTHRVWIDANPIYPSLNLAQAVMVCAYEMRKTLQEYQAMSASGMADLPVHPLIVERASQEAVNAALTHLQEGLVAIGYLDPENPKKLMPRLRALFDRAGLQKEEIDLLRGIAKLMILKK